MSLTCWLVGEGTLPIRCGEILLGAGHTVLGVASPDPALVAWARERGIRTVETRAALAKAIADAPFDYLFSVVNFWIIPDEVIAAARTAAINFHDGPLPRYAGSYVTSWALLSGERTHGITWHVMTDVVDGGDILKQRTFEVSERDTAVTLNARCYEAAIAAFTELVPELARGTATRVPQDLDRRTFFARDARPAAAAVVDWQAECSRLSDLVRGLDFGQYANPLALPKVATGGGDCFTFSGIRRIGPATGRVGTLVQIDADALTVSCADADVAVSGFRTLEGGAVNIQQALARHGLTVGARLPILTPDEVSSLSARCEAVSHHEGYWIEALGHAGPVSVPYVASRTEAPGRTAVALSIDGALAESLRRLFPDVGTADCVVTAFVVALARITGVEVFDLGYRVAATSPASTAGLFASVVPIRIALGAKESFVRALAAVGAARTSVARRQTFARDLYQRVPSLRGLTHEWPVVVDERGLESLPEETTAHVTLSVGPDGSARLLANAGIVGTAAAAQLRDHVVTLLDGVARSPETPLDHLPLLQPQERERVLVTWNQTEQVYLPKPMHELFEHQVAKTPDAIAAGFEGQVLTYQELNGRANRLARRLRQRGVAPGVLVGVCAERSLEMLIAVLGIFKAGGAYVPLDPSFPRDRLTFMAEDAALGLVVTKGDVAALLRDMNGESVGLDAVDDPAIWDGSNLEPSAGPDDLAYVLYTSGSTGKPKGVEVPHRALTNFLCSMQREPGCGAADIVLAITTLSFDIAGLELYLPLISGGRVQIASRRVAVDGRLLQEHIDTYGVTMVQATPATWRMLIATGWQGASRVRALCGGEPLPPDLVQGLTARTAELWNMYGPTETTIWSSVQRVRSDDAEITIGRPIANTTFYVVDANLQPVPVGVPGELCIGGDGVARGYRRRPELTADRFVPDPFVPGAGRRLYRTGDLARYRADGQVVHLGRLDHQVKLRGFRIELGEIETLLAGHPAVRSAVVVARDTDRGADAYLAAYLVASGSARPSVGDLRAHLQGTLPEYMVPSAFVFLEAFPMTPNGKVDRKALPAPERERTRASAYVAPRTPIEDSVVAIWQHALKVAQVSVEDNFFELGGHSLSGLEISVRIEQTLGVHLPLQALFETPTPAGLAARVEAALVASADEALLDELLAEIEQVPKSSH